MKNFIAFMRHLPMEGYILGMLAIMIVGSATTAMLDINRPTGDGVHAGTGVEDHGTNPWQ